MTNQPRATIEAHNTIANALRMVDDTAIENGCVDAELHLLTDAIQALRTLRNALVRRIESK